MGDEPKTTPAKKKEGRVAPPLSDRAVRIISSLASVKVIVRDRETDWKNFLEEDHPGADSAKKEIESLLKIYTR